MIKITAIRFKTLQVSLISLGEYIYIYITQQENMRKRKFFLKKKDITYQGCHSPVLQQIACNCHFRLKLRMSHTVQTRWSCL